MQEMPFQWPQISKFFVGPLEVCRYNMMLIPVEKPVFPVPLTTGEKIIVII